MDTPFRSGLEGVIVAETEISHVDGPNGRLIYRGGYRIEELADRGYEEIVHLLLYGRLPDPTELAGTTADMTKHRELNTAARAALAGLPTSADPMDALRTVLSAQGAQRCVAPPTTAEAIAVTAVAATAVAAYHRHRQGLPLPETRTDLGHVANFLYQLHGREPDPVQVCWLETYFVVTADHALSPSTFTAQIVGSTGSDLWSAIVAAVSALKGPAHGGATVEATRMVELVGDAKHAESFVLDVLRRRGRLMGFGHREYRRYDPRARILANVCQAANPGYHTVARAIEEVALRELARRHPERPNLTNVDYFAGGVLSGVGVPLDFFACLFAAARTVGWAAHVVEYVERGERIVSPASCWIGPDASSAESSVSERRTGLNLTELEQGAIDSPINLSDGHPRQDPTGSQAKLICRLPEFFEIGAAEPFVDIERRAQAAFLGALGQASAPLDGGRVFSVYSSSVATLAVANLLTGHRVALIHPTFDNIHDLLARRAAMIPMSEDACAEGDLSQALAANATCVFVTTPNNPTGRVLAAAALRRLADGCVAKGLLLCLDVSFRGFDLRAQFDHYAVLEDSGADYVVIEDTGKLWPMQELKLGFIAVSESMRVDVDHALSDVLLTVSPFVLTLIEMLSVDAAQGGLAELHRLVADNRRIVLDAVDGLDCVELLDPRSRISVGRLRFHSPADADRTRRELYERGVHVLPCRQFHWADQQQGAGLLRVALARNGATLAEGMRRLAAVRASMVA